ncbi:MAG: type II toxin-antitoxin system VapC family toxin [Candidatus Methanofastidiosia archaeon]
MFKGAYRTEKHQETSKKVKSLLESLEILDFSLSACQTFGKLSNDLKMIGEEIGDMDTLIASIVLTHNEILVTKNIKHFEKIPNLIVEIW